MIVTAWRITKRSRSHDAFTGDGAKKYGGRWNSPGTPCIYTAQSQALAALDFLVHTESPELLAKYVLIAVEIDEQFISEISRSLLPRNWQADPSHPKLRHVGDQWVNDASTAVLRVPSALVPNEHNFLLNPLHPDFKNLRIGKPISFRFDSRLSR